MRSVPVQRRSKRTRDNLIQAAISIIREEGRDHFTTAQIAARAGVSVGTFYKYFDDRVDILDLLYPNRSEGLGPLQPQDVGVDE